MGCCSVLRSTPVLAFASTAGFLSTSASQSRDYLRGIYSAVRAHNRRRSRPAKAFMKVAIAQFPVARARINHNLETIEARVAEAASRGACLIILPEMATTGFDWAYNRSSLSAAEEAICTIAGFASKYSIALCGSFLRGSEGAEPVNAMLYIDAEGRVRSQYNKIHLFSLFNEDRYMEAGQKPTVLETAEAIIGFSICYDLRFPELFRKTTQMGAEVQILSAAFPHPRLSHWQTLLRARAIENQCYLIAANQCGYESHGDEIAPAHYFGHSMVIDPWGEVLAEADEEERLMIAEIDLSRVSETRRKLPALRDRRPDLF